MLRSMFCEVGKGVFRSVFAGVVGASFLQSFHAIALGWFQEFAATGVVSVCSRAYHCAGR